MNLNILCDINWESKIDHAVKVVDTTVMDVRDYGDGLKKLVVILNCRDPELNYRQRIRFSKTEGTCYIDVMLKLSDFVRSTHITRRKKIYDELLDQVSKTIRARKLPNFRIEDFLVDLRTDLDIQLNGAESCRFDSSRLEVAAGY